MSEMKSIPRTGMSAEERMTVGEGNRISFADERMPAVLATPWLVAHLEYAARRAIAPCLEDARAERRDLRRGRTPRPGPRGLHGRLPRPGHPRQRPGGDLPGRGPRRRRADRPRPPPPPGHRRRPLRPPGRPQAGGSLESVFFRVAHALGWQSPKRVGFNQRRRPPWDRGRPARSSIQSNCGRAPAVPGEHNRGSTA